MVVEDPCQVLLVGRVQFRGSSAATVVSHLLSSRLAVAPRSRSHSSSVSGRSLMICLPTAASTCQASRQCAGYRFFNQK
jgi:hypothetical protein